MKKNYSVVWGTSSSGRIELPFTYDMLLCGGNGTIARAKADGNGLNEVEKEFRRILYSLSDEIVMEFLGEWFYEEDDEEWLAEASREEKLFWVADIIESELRDEFDLEEGWAERSQPFEIAA